MFLHSIFFHDISFGFHLSLSLWLIRPRKDDKTTKKTGKESKYEMKVKEKQSSINRNIAECSTHDRWCVAHNRQRITSKLLGRKKGNTS